ncbi:hypothetical protein CO665_34660 [Rhizobium anhuiense]|uniref:hypothetical protein n=1 Tax=Rhizobium anhuiense TaxID=1184720 RepID=UPI000BEA3F58|nr:hypothetical protein [Rhizobium anhuiense]PDS33727.1 hypothetical protein CO665_34660 [Rhizobium anhuiense]
MNRLRSTTRSQPLDSQAPRILVVENEADAQNGFAFTASSFGGNPVAAIAANPTLLRIYFEPSRQEDPITRRIQPTLSRSLSARALIFRRRYHDLSRKCHKTAHQPPGSQGTGDQAARADVDDQQRTRHDQEQELVIGGGGGVSYAVIQTSVDYARLKVDSIESSIDSVGTEPTNLPAGQKGPLFS